MAAGVPDELYWSCTPVEAGALLGEIVEAEGRRQYHDACCAAMVACAVFNSKRQKSSDRVWKIADFVKPPRERVRIVSREEMIRQMLAFAESHNRALAARQAR